MFYCMFYFTCDRSCTVVVHCTSSTGGRRRMRRPPPEWRQWCNFACRRNSFTTLKFLFISSAAANQREINQMSCCLINRITRCSVFMWPVSLRFAMIAFTFTFNYLASLRRRRPTKLQNGTRTALINLQQIWFSYFIFLHISSPYFRRTDFHIFVTGTGSNLAGGRLKNTRLALDYWVLIVIGY